MLITNCEVPAPIQTYLSTRAINTFLNGTLPILQIWQSPSASNNRYATERNYQSTLGLRSALDGWLHIIAAQANSPKIASFYDDIRSEVFKNIYAHNCLSTSTHV